MVFDLNKCICRKYSIILIILIIPLFLIMALLHFSCSKQQVLDHQECITSEKPRCLERNKAEVPKVMGKDDAFKLSQVFVFFT